MTDSSPADPIPSDLAPDADQGLPVEASEDSGLGLPQPTLESRVADLEALVDLLLMTDPSSPNLDPTNDEEAH